ncbi:MAG: hypothetical protein RI885_609 [Actinomycetota bacterium]
MTDDRNWQAPGPEHQPAGGAAGGDHGAAPVYGPPADGPSTSEPPPVPPVALPYGAPPGWTPPPKPGLIPLRPLSFGTILGAPYQLLRRNPRPTFGVSLLVQGVVTVLLVGVVGTVSFLSLTRAESAAGTDEYDTLIAGSVLAIALSALIPVALSLVAGGVLQGIIVLEASRQSVGEKLRLPQLWARAKSRVWAVAGFTVMVSLALLLAILVIVLIAVGLSLLGTGGVIGAVVASLVLGLGLVVVSAWLGTKLAFVPSILMVERATLSGAITRSWALTGGSFWRLFGTLLLVAAILNVATSIATFPVNLLAQSAPVIFAATGDEAVITAITVGATVLLLVVSLAVGALTLVIQSATTALLYIDQRMRREGLDLALTEYVEARQSGRTDLADPYDVRSGGFGPGTAPPTA